jgi:hypothetical protein
MQSISCTMGGQGRFGNWDNVPVSTAADQHILQASAAYMKGGEPNTLATVADSLSAIVHRSRHQQGLETSHRWSNPGGAAHPMNAGFLQA